MSVTIDTFKMVRISSMRKPSTRGKKHLSFLHPNETSTGLATIWISYFEEATSFWLFIAFDIRMYCIKDPVSSLKKNSVYYEWCQFLQSQIIYFFSKPDFSVIVFSRNCHKFKHNIKFLSSKKFAAFLSVWLNFKQKVYLFWEKKKPKWQKKLTGKNIFVGWLTVRWFGSRKEGRSSDLRYLHCLSMILKRRSSFGHVFISWEVELTNIQTF